VPQPPPPRPIASPTLGLDALCVGIDSRKVSWIVEGLWDRQAEYICGLAIDHQLERGRLHHRQLRGFRTLENPAGIEACLAIGAGNACRIAHQTAGFDVIARIVNCRNGMAGRQCNQPLALAGEERTAARAGLQDIEFATVSQRVPGPAHVRSRPRNEEAA